MSLAVGAVSSSKNMGFDKNKEGGENSGVNETKTTETHQEGGDNEIGGGFGRTISEASLYTTEEEEEDEGSKIQLGPQCTLKEQLEKDKV